MNPKQLSDSMLDLAERWIELWGDSMRERREKGGGLYAELQADGEPSTARMIDDPRSCTFKILQVELALKSLDPTGSSVRLAATHIWVDKAPLGEYDEERFRAFATGYGLSKRDQEAILLGLQRKVVSRVASMVRERAPNVHSAPELKISEKV